MPVAKYRTETGSVSHATMRSEDLIPRFISTLDGIREEMIGHYSTALASPGQVEECKRDVSLIDDLLGQIERRTDEPEYYETAESMFDLEDLFNMLDEFSPDGHYFGAHPGDGCDYGFWEVEE